MLIALPFACYLAGGGIAMFLTRRGTPDWWGTFIRGQFLVAGATLSVAAGWRFQLGEQLLGAVALATVMYGITLAAVLTRNQGGKRRSLGECVLEAWASNPNDAYWIIPLATVVAGSTGTVIAVLEGQILLPLVAWWISRLRRDAPTPQHVRTSAFDYAGPIGFALGLLLAQLMPAPDWTRTVLAVMSTFMAFIGAAMWAGSVRHTLARLDKPTAEGWRRYLTLSAVRIVIALTVVAIFWGEPVAPLAFLAAFTVPTFFPANATVLYGYHCHVTGIASRYGWVLAPVGLGLAWLAA